MIIPRALAVIGWGKGGSHDHICILESRLMLHHREPFGEWVREKGD